MAFNVPSSDTIFATIYAPPSKEASRADRRADYATDMSWAPDFAYNPASSGRGDRDTDMSCLPDAPDPEPADNAALDQALDDII